MNEVKELLDLCQCDLAWKTEISVMFVWETEPIHQVTARACAQTNSKP
jgi:hypothetical protein